MSTRFSLSMEVNRLTRDGTAEPVSRDQILRRERGQGNVDFPLLIFPVQRTTSRIGNPNLLLLHVMTIHTCMRPGSHTQLAKNCLCPLLFCFSLFLGSCRFLLFTSILYNCRFLPVWRAPCTLPFRMMLFYLVTTGWNFYISLRDNSMKKNILINNNKNTRKKRHFQRKK